MGITLQFGSYEEMVLFAKKLVGEPAEGQKKQKAPVEEVEVKKNLVTGETKIEPVTAEDEVPVEEETKTYTLEEIRAAMAELTRKGKAKDVKALLTSVGAKNLSGVDPKDYATLMEKAGAI